MQLLRHCRGKRASQRRCFHGIVRRNKFSRRRTTHLKFKDGSSQRMRLIIGFGRDAEAPQSRAELFPGPDDEVDFIRMC
jgi:hypothetical protein